MFSILLIAVHRYIGVFKVDLFKRMNKSNLLIVLIIVSTWIFAVILTIIDKYAFSTTYSITMCLDGFSSNWLFNLLYAVYFVVLSMFIPTIIIVTIYVLINRKLNELGQKLSTDVSSTRTATGRLINQKRERRFAQQFILMCLVVVLNICGISIYSIRAVVPNYFLVFYYWRYIVRCWILVMVSLVPILSLAFNPSIKRITRSFALLSSYASQENLTRGKN